MEVKVTDFRIGNWVSEYECEPFYFEIEQISKYIGSELWAVYRNGSIKCKSPQPIKLTEEWLLKFGFEKKESIWSLNEIELTSWFTFRFSKNPLKLQEIDYVHQIQNLYFALTGEELIIKKEQ
jgi:hypothetical protein